MEVILTEEIEALGPAGSVVNVKPGYARNYLLPRNLAVRATGASLKELEHRKRVVAARHAQSLASAKDQQATLEAQRIQIARRAGEEGRLFGSVTSIDIHRVLEERGLAVDRRKIRLDEPLKALGEFAVPVRLMAEVIATLKVEVIAESD